MILMRTSVLAVILTLALVGTAVLSAGVSSTPVSWESVNGAGPGRPTLSSITWRTASFGALSVRDPATSDWIELRHLGTKRNDSSLGAMFVGKCDDGRRVQVTLIGKPYYAPTRFEYALTFSQGSKERMFYGNCSDDLIGCFKANR
jgi:hypothetical protein